MVNKAQRPFLASESKSLVRRGRSVDVEKRDDTTRRKSEKATRRKAESDVSGSDKDKEPKHPQMRIQGRPAKRAKHSPPSENPTRQPATRSKEDTGKKTDRRAEETPSARPPAKTRGKTTQRPAKHRSPHPCAQKKKVRLGKEVVGLEKEAVHLGGWVDGPRRGMRPRPLDISHPMPLYVEGRDKELYDLDGGAFHAWLVGEGAAAPAPVVIHPLPSLWEKQHQQQREHDARHHHHGHHGHHQHQDHYQQQQGEAREHHDGQHHHEHHGAHRHLGHARGHEQGSHPRAIRTPAFREVVDYDRHYDADRPFIPPLAYLRHRERPREELDALVEYDLDEDDAAWLVELNQRLAASALPSVTEDGLELAMDRLEKECHRREECNQARAKAEGEEAEEEEEAEGETDHGGDSSFSDAENSDNEKSSTSVAPESSNGTRPSSSSSSSEASSAEAMDEEEGGDGSSDTSGDGVSEEDGSDEGDENDEDEEDNKGSEEEHGRGWGEADGSHGGAWNGRATRSAAVLNSKALGKISQQQQQNEKTTQKQSLDKQHEEALEVIAHQPAPPAHDLRRRAALPAIKEEHEQGLVATGARHLRSQVPVCPPDQGAGMAAEKPALNAGNGRVPKRGVNDVALNGDEEVTAGGKEPREHAGGPGLRVRTAVNKEASTQRPQINRSGRGDMRAGGENEGGHGSRPTAGNRAVHADLGPVLLRQGSRGGDAELVEGKVGKAAKSEVEPGADQAGPASIENTLPLDDAVQLLGSEFLAHAREGAHEGPPRQHKAHGADHTPLLVWGAAPAPGSGHVVGAELAGGGQEAAGVPTEVGEQLYRYWVKRRSSAGAPLLERFRQRTLPHKPVEKDESDSEDFVPFSGQDSPRPSGRKRAAMAQHEAWEKMVSLRCDLELVRLICDMVVRREKLKKEALLLAAAQRGAAAAQGGAATVKTGSAAAERGVAGMQGEGKSALQGGTTGREGASGISGTGKHATRTCVVAPVAGNELVGSSRLQGRGGRDASSELPADAFVGLGLEGGNGNGDRHVAPGREGVRARQLANGKAKEAKGTAREDRTGRGASNGPKTKSAVDASDGSDGDEDVRAITVKPHRACDWCQGHSKAVKCAACHRRMCYKCFKRRKGLGVKGWANAVSSKTFTCSECSSDGKHDSKSGRHVLRPS